MKAVLIGSGNVATILGRKIISSGNEVLQVISEHRNHAEVLAHELHCAFGDRSTPVVTEADIYIVAISDFSLSQLDQWLHLNNKLVVHTAGSMPMDVLKNVSPNHGILYPFQSLHKKMNHIPEIPFLVNAANADSSGIIIRFLESLGCSYRFVSDEQRLHYHACGVVVNNFPNHLFALVEDFCKSKAIDFEVMKPLITETAFRASKYSPQETQTGPAFRNDAFIMEKHLRVFQDYPALRTMYIRFTDSIIHFYEKYRNRN